MQKIILSEICRKCGECCKNYPFVELSHNEIYALEKLTGLPFYVFTDKKDEGSEEFFLQFKKNGNCFFLHENNDDYSCGVYESRPVICRNYPSKSIQNEVCNANREKTLSNNSG